MRTPPPTPLLRILDSESGNANLSVVGGEGAVMEKEDSIRGMLGVLRGLKAEDSGKFFAYDGKEKAW